MKNITKFTTFKDYTFAIVILVVALVWAGFAFATASTTAPEHAPAIEQMEDAHQQNISGVIPNKEFIGTQKASVGMIP